MLGKIKVGKLGLLEHIRVVGAVLISGVAPGFSLASAAPKGRPYVQIRTAPEFEPPCRVQCQRDNFGRYHQGGFVS